MEKYMVIEPSGDIRWIEIQRENMLQEFRKVIGCDCLEQVRTIVRGVCLIVDESGKIKDPPQQHNEIASLLYLGYILGNDDIAGPAVLVSIGLVDGEPDWVPLNARELQRLRAMGLRVTSHD